MKRLVLLSSVLFVAACEPNYRAYFKTQSLPPGKATVSETDLTLPLGTAERIVYEIRDGDTVYTDAKPGDLQVTSNVPGSLRVAYGTGDFSYVFFAEAVGSGEIIVRYKDKLALRTPFVVKDE